MLHLEVLKKFVLPKRPADRYNFLVQHEYILSKYIIKYIDKEFFDNTLDSMGIVDDIQMIFDSFRNGISASTSRYGKHVLIRVDVFKFINWVDRMDVFNAVSIGENGCDNFFSCFFGRVLDKKLEYLEASRVGVRYSTSG